MTTIAEIDPPKHVAVVLKTPRVSGEDFAFMVAAVAVQVREQLCPAWGLAPVEVAAYTDDAQLPDTAAGVIFIVDTDGNDDSLGYHTKVGNLAYGFVDVTQTLADGGSVSAVLSHEVLEMVLDQGIDTWAPGPDGNLWAVEACDPVEAFSYMVGAELAGELRNVAVSDFLLPNFFVAGSEKCSFLGRVRAFEIAPGGYQITKDKSGRTIYLDSVIQKKLARKVSRTARRA